MTKDKKIELTRRITQANKTQMITILYEMVLAYNEDALNARDAGNYDEFDLAIRREGACMNELIHSLHLEYPIALKFLEIYIYIKKLLVKAIATREKVHLEHVQMLIEKMHTTYLELEKMDDSTPHMKNVQTVYAGLTYSRNSLSESVAGAVLNRGFTA